MLTSITHPVNKVKGKKNPNTKNLSQKKMTQALLNLYFQKMGPPTVTVTVRILERDLRSQ